MNSADFGLFTGAEAGVLAASPLSTPGGPSIQSSVPRKNDSGLRGGDFYFQSSTSSVDSFLKKENLPIPLEEVIFEFGYQAGEAGTVSSVSINDLAGVNRGPGFSIASDGTMNHRTGGSANAITTGTLEDTSITGLFPIGLWRFVSCHSLIAASPDGFMITLVEDVEVLNTQNIATDGGAGGLAAGQIVLAGDQTARWDDIWIRPRTVLADAAGAITGTPDADALVTGATSTETALAYAWQSNTADSEGGVGDPDLPADTFRLFLKTVSFGPAATSGGFQDGEVVTVAGLSGITINIDAPHAGYVRGLEPGGQFAGRGLFLERAAVTVTGTDNTDGTLVGGAADRADALQNVDDGKRIESVVAGDVITVETSDLTSQSTIDRIAMITLYMRASSDGADPNGLQGRLRDDGTIIQRLRKQQVAGTQTVLQEGFDRNAAGGEWTPGPGAGGLDSLQVGYQTSTS